MLEPAKLSPTFFYFFVKKLLRKFYNKFFLLFLQKLQNYVEKQQKKSTHIDRQTERYFVIHRMIGA